MRTPERWDIFCRVVDNFGDAGVCWRLARALVREHAASVRLWIDDLGSLQRLEPAVTPAAIQIVADVEVRRWDAEFSGTALGDVVIEAFGCRLPEAYVTAMASASRPPLWIVLEYLSAEPWVREHHGLPSPHPQWPLERYFFFPGFVSGTGGLLLESDLFARREVFDRPSARDAFWRSLEHRPPHAEATVVSVFAYENAPLRELLDTWTQGPKPTIAVIPQTAVLQAVLAYFDANEVPHERTFSRGALEARIIPFLPQVRYDELLWSCDCNFVRGEDSFVRAQWAARPFVWHIYEQEERAHWAKLDAFLELYCEGLAEAPRRAAEDMMRVWNQVAPARVTPGSAWTAFEAHRGELREHARRWADRVAAVGGLAGNLARFCSEKLK